MKQLNFILLSVLLAFLAACVGNADYSPKPKGYFRIAYPEKKYNTFSEEAPFSFDYPAYGQLLEDKEQNAGNYWYNLSFPQFNGRLHLTYYPISSIKDYEMMVEDARKLAFKHTVKASAIDQKLINYPEHKVYGVYYEIDGNTASSVQFFLTDSTRNYFRGALYFNERPQYDSIAPVIAFLKKDIDRLISSFKWKNDANGAKNVRPEKLVIPKPHQPNLRTAHHKISDAKLYTPNISVIPELPAVAETGSKYARNAVYVTRPIISEDDTLEKTASKFFSAFMNGNLDDAYTYFAKDFTDKVKVAQLVQVKQTFLMTYGAYKGIKSIVIKTVQNQKVGIISATFENASPVFTIYFNNEDKIVGFFNPEQNLIAKYKDPAYADPAVYEESEIVVQTGDIRLPGILTVPKNKTNFPIVVLVHGSGAGDRDEGFGGVKPFRDLALGLAAKGIATLRYDKRTRVNPGSFSKIFTVKEEVLDDAQSAIELAKNTPGVNKNEVYALGHSLGGMLMPRIAENNTTVKGIIVAAGPARPFQDISIEQNELSFKQNGGTESNRADLDKVIAMLNSTRFKMLGNTKPDSVTVYGPAAYIMDLNNYDQLRTVTKFKGKVLIIQGEKDFQVSMKDFELWKTAIKNNKRSAAISYPSLNHMFSEAGTTNSITDYYKAQNIPADVINDIANFILKK